MRLADLIESMEIINGEPRVSIVDAIWHAECCAAFRVDCDHGVMELGIGGNSEDTTWHSLCFTRRLDSGAVARCTIRVKCRVPCRIEYDNIGGVDSVLVSQLAEPIILESGKLTYLT